jgi:hypothetical protein
MDLDSLFDYPARRRWWLLTQALACAPFDRALELARASDQFLQAEDTTRIQSAAVQAEPRSIPEGVCSAPDIAEDQPRKVSRLLLSSEQREELIDRFAQGANNTDLAEEFGLAPRQIQGIRMGAARKIATRRPASEATPSPDQQAIVSASIEDVVRYLRQQDDVVVADGEGAFLINGRFHLQLTELVDKANRIRRRQNMPLFQLEGRPPRPLQAELREANANSPISGGFWSNGEHAAAPRLK